jgi:exodeoxyribonuclease V beta subunit
VTRVTVDDAVAATPQPFDLLGPLPEGTTVLEASAGTGKTFTIANLVARYVAEGVATMEQLLVVSFSRESTRELRERVRERLVSARDRLTDPAAAPADDRVLQLLADTDPATLAVRRRRLEEALAVFDAATVTTTHGFCQQVLLALGTAGDHDTGAVLVENIGDLVSEVADDLYLRKWGTPRAGPPDLTRAEFQDLATAAAADPATTLVPAAGTDGVPGQRARIAAAVRAEVDRRKRRQQLVDYDDMLIRLAGTLTDPDIGPVARARLRARYQVVLVDEFQDTDPVQWTILRAAFHGHRTLVLIGDPKQAIYGFRGADVHAYLEAKASASVVRTLPTNHRSDAGLLDGLAALLGGAALGDPRIRVLPVEAAHRGRLVDAAVPVQLRVLPRDGLPVTAKGVATVGPARDAVAGDLADRVVALLDGSTRLHPRDGGPPRPVAPRDVAVLVRTYAQAELVQARLQAAQVPVVLTGKTSVFSTPAAAEWQLLLEALEQPHRTTRVRRLALSCFVGLDAAGLDARGDAFADDLALRLRVWGAVLAERGVAAMFEAVSLDQELQPRILGQVGGERLLTDLRHIAQGLHEAALDGQLGLTALVVWLRRRREEARREGGQERSRRLETDAAAVQVITVHTSKGLEFPVVLVPFAWDNFAGREPSTAVFHDEADQRVRDVGGPGSPGWSDHVRRHKQEEIDDELRLTYVALTRAQSHLLVWWAPSTNTPTAPLHRLLLHDDPAAVAPQAVPVPDDATALAAFRARAAASDGGLGVEVVRPGPPAVWSPPAEPAPALQLAAFTRALDTGWRRTSYTALVSTAHEQRLGSEPEVAQKDDEADLEEVLAAAAAGDAALRAVVSAWDAIPGSAAFGTLVHSVLEQLDDPADDTALAAAVAAHVARLAPGLDVAALTAGLRSALATPLGDVTEGRALRDVAAADRLPELDFELPLAGGDDATTARAALDGTALRDLVPLWRAQLPAGPLSAYADALAELPDVPLRGYLTGSIDAVLRVGTPAAPRYVVVDYKTNRLGGHDEPLTAWHYRPGALGTAMVEAHYPLQALLYAVALHRYLRWRQPAYDPDVHLGGCLYLFLRGMSGPGVSAADGAAPGVFSWRPPTGLVVGTSELLAGRV